MATQTQAAVVGIGNIRKPPKSLTTFLKENTCIWIIDTGWNSCLREFIPLDRMVEWNKLKPTTRNRASVTELLDECHWPNLRVPEERGGYWKSLSPSEEEISWISFITWAKVTAAWTIGLEEPCLMISKDIDPSRVWAKVAKANLKWVPDESVKSKISELWDSLGNSLSCERKARESKKRKWDHQEKSRA